jgi:hypothetical protein
MSSINLKAGYAHVRYHAAAYMLAAAMGILCVAPYAYFATTPEYQGIALMGQDAEEHYMARMQEAYEGRPGLGNVFTPYKEVPYLSPGLGEAVMAGAAKLTGLQVADITLAAKFLLPALIFLLIYGFGLSISRSRLTALLGAAAAMLGTAIMSNPHELLALARGQSIVDGITWARPINPQISGLMLFGGLWLLCRAYMQRDKISWSATGAIGIVIGLSLYVSVYTWSFLGLLLFSIFILEAAHKNYRAAGKLLGAGIVGLLLAVPFLLNYLSAMHMPGYAAATQFQGALASHAPALGIWLLILLALPWLAWKQEPSVRIFFILCGLALAVALNQQVITGVYLQPGHYHWYITKPLAALLAVLVAAPVMRRYSSVRVARAVCAAGIFILMAHGAAAQEHFYARHAPGASLAQAYAPLLEHLRSAPQEAVYANPTLSDYVAIYTPDDAPNSTYAGLYFLPEDYLKERLFFEYRLRGITADKSLEAMKSERDMIAAQLFGSSWSGIPEDKAPLPDAVLEGLAQDYRAEQGTTLAEMMETLGIERVVLDTQDDTWPGTHDLLPDERVGRFTLYRLP